jgi:diguanylate cyclase (GGDEF)-like protein/PAS domain S-box-containing protein
MSSPAPPQPGASAATSDNRLAVVLVYACFSALWILLSDRLVTALVSDPDVINLLNTGKGWVFVAVTSALLYWLLRRGPAATVSNAAAEPAAQRRQRLAFIGVLCSACIGIALLSAWNSWHEEKAVARGRLQSIAETRARELATWNSERLQDAAWAQRSLLLRELWLRWRQSGRADDALRLRQFLNGFFVNDANFSRVQIIDVEGHVALNSAIQALPASPQGAPDAHPTLQQAVLEALTTNQPQRAGPWRNADGKLRLAFVAPLAAESAWPAALVLHLDPPEYLHPALKALPLPIKTADLLVYRPEGNELVMLNAPRYAEGGALRTRLPLDDEQYLSVQALRGKTPEGELLEGWDYRQVATLGVAKRIPGTDWWVLAKQDQSELLRNALVRSAWIALAVLAVGTTLYLHDERRRLRDSALEIEKLRRIEQSLGQSEAQYRQLAENTSDVVWLYDLDKDRYLYASPSVERQLGYSVEEVLAMSVEGLVAPDDLPRIRRGMARRVQAFTQGDDSLRTLTHEALHRHKDGHLVPLEVVSTLLTDEAGHTHRMLGVARDISGRKQAQAELVRLSQAIEQSPASVIITGLDGRIEYVNHAFEHISGYSRAEVLGQKPAILRSDHTQPDVYANLWATLRGGHTWTGELINRHKSGREYVQSMNVAPVRNEQGRVTHYLAVQMDVTAQRNAEQKAHQLAWFNQLTGLPNRHRLLVELEEVLQSHARTGEECALLLLNLDRFQTVNDALGHNAGDQLLKQLGQRLDSLVHANDRLAHLSADEFAVLLHAGSAGRETASSHALRWAQELHERLDAPFTLAKGEIVNISCGVGITLLPLGPGDTPGEVLRRADTALHRAKDAGVRQTAFFDASMEKLISHRFTIERDLRRGLVAGELRLYLQPQVNAQGHVVAAEALVRWQHPEHGLMLPAGFIPIAEESELISELGRWVLNSVCRELGELRRDGLHLPISVNISPRQFHQPGFVHVVQDILQRHEAAPHDLVIEITESIVMDRMDSVVQKMAHLNSLGVQFSLDDFGTGYSSLAYLKRLPIHELKIDRSFVQDAPDDPNDAALVEAILSVARHLRLKVVAEGVETVEQAQFLQAHGEVRQQGFLHGRPEPAADLLARWRAGHGVLERA